MFWERWEFINARAMEISYLLSPETAGTEMSDDGPDCEEEAMANTDTYLKEFYAEDEEKQDLCIKEFEKFCKEISYMTEEAQQKFAKLKPKKYWATTGKVKYPNLAMPALRIFSIPASNCSSERNWKIFANMMTKTRNRLSPQKANKLVAVQQNCFLLDEEDRVDYSDE